MVAITLCNNRPVNNECDHVFVYPMYTGVSAGVIVGIVIGTLSFILLLVVIVVVVVVLLVTQRSKGGFSCDLCLCSR